MTNESNPSAIEVLVMIFFLANASTIFSLLFIFLYGEKYISSNEIVEASVAIASICAPIMFILCAILSIKFKIGFRGVVSGVLGIIFTLAISRLAGYYDIYIWRPELDYNIIIILCIILLLEILVGAKEKLTGTE